MPLLMNAKPLKDVLKVNPERWNALAARLATAYPIVPKKDMVYPLCTAYYAFDRKPLVTPATAAGNALITDVVDFLRVFMTANGQWDHINRQPWFTSRDYVIGIDVNFYPNRAQQQYKLTPQFHKDTGGNNIFVNLLFDNKNPIEATEWFVDVEEPGDLRRKWQDQLLPEVHRKELTNLRAYLRSHRVDQQSLLMVEGGVLDGENICVSWVDDLVWHATPSVNERIAYTAVLAKADYDAANKAASVLATWLETHAHLDYYDDFAYLTYKSTSSPIDIHLVELMGTIADDPTTRLVEWLAEKKKRPQDVDCDLAVNAWMALYAKDRATFDQDVAKRERAPWRMTGAVSEANAADPRLETDPAYRQSPKIMEPPVGLSKLRRTNSAGSEATRKRLKEVAEANAKVPRRFIRTWVRVLPRTSEEVRESGFQF